MSSNIENTRHSRVEYFDIAKGILIILVVLGHVFETGPVNQYVYSFHMPAFFIISGIMQYLSGSTNKSLHQAVLGKIYSLIIPFLFFELLGVISNIVRFGVTLNIFGYASNTLRLWCNNGPNWFVWALFVDELMFFLVHKYVPNRYARICISAAIGAFMIVNHNIYSTFGSTGVGFLFLTFGYYTAPVYMKQRSKAVSLVAGAVSVISCFMNGKVDLGPWVFGSVPLYIISALSGTVFVIELSKFISSKFLRYYGQNSLTVLGTHQAINLPIRTLSGIAAYSVPMGTLVFLGLVIIQIPIIFVFNRTIPFLIGKKNGVVAKKVLDWINK